MRFFEKILLYHSFRLPSIAILHRHPAEDAFNIVKLSNTQGKAKWGSAHPSSCLINNAHIFCDKPNLATAITRRTLPSTVLNMAKEKKEESP